jgi:hypothetical protein
MGALEHRREVGFLPGCRPSAFMVVLYFPAVFSGTHSFLQTGFHVKWGFVRSLHDSYPCAKNAPLESIASRAGFGKHNSQK